jgi:ERO1-like protein alpha
MHYVNLQKYPEGNTGYGKDGTIVWNRIYNENCFKVDDMCLEERVFFRLISGKFLIWKIFPMTTSVGLHTSINSHVARNWALDPESGEWTANVGYFASKMWPFQDRIRNLYFSYLFMLR